MPIAVMKNHLIATGLILLVATTGLAQTAEFNQPWKDQHAALVIDPYQGNEIVWDELLSEPRLAGIIHRATIGDRVDTRYAERKEEAKRRGLKWGSYHLGRPGDPVKQADFYLQTAKPGSDEVMALDIESLDNARDMSLLNARRFIKRIKKKTGRYPFVYANQLVTKAISDRFSRDKVFSKTHLWYARFKSQVTDFPTTTWKTYTLWQFSCEINCTAAALERCLIRVPGTQTDMDVNVYHGTVAELKAKWPFR